MQLHWENCSDEELKKCLQSPFYFTVANLVTEEDTETPLLPVKNYLSGTTVSSLYRLRDVDNSDGGFFVFGDLAVKQEGKFKLRFSLFEIVEGQVQNRKTILSDTFTVFIPKHFPGPLEATFLSRTFSDQGVKMRIRKEHRLQNRKKRKSEASNDAPVTKKYQSKKSNRTIVSSPPYAESSSTTAPSDVFFGRWQSSTTHKHNTGSITPPPTEEPEPQHHSNGLKDILNHHSQIDPIVQQSFPSPESTIYNNLPHTRSMSWGQHSETNTSSSGSWPIPATRTSSPQQQQQSLIAAHHYTDSPPSMSIQLPPTSSLANYHTCSDAPNRNDSKLPTTPPTSITDLHQKATGSHTWGTRLPPLRAIMDCKQPQSSLFPLLLPPPTQMVVDYNSRQYS